MPFNNIRNILGLPQEDQDIYDVPRFGGSEPQRVPAPTPELTPSATTGQPAGLSEIAKNASSIFKMSSPMAYALETAGNPQAPGNVIENIEPTHASQMAKIIALGKFNAPKSIEELAELAKKQNLLHHSTTKENLSRIAEEGLVPRVGEVSKKWYGENVDPVSFLSQEPRGWIGGWQHNLKTGNPTYEMSPEMLNKNTGLALFSRNEDIYKAIDPMDRLVRSSLEPKGGLFQLENQLPSSVEPGDFFTFKKQMPELTISDEDVDKYLKLMDPKYKSYIDD